MCILGGGTIADRLFFSKHMQQNTPEFLEFVKQCQEQFLGISLPTIEILYARKIQETTYKTPHQDEKTTTKKTKK